MQTSQEHAKKIINLNKNLEQNDTLHIVIKKYPKNTALISIKTFQNFRNA